jgi:hypothetical protein
MYEPVIARTKIKRDRPGSLALVHHVIIFMVLEHIIPARVAVIITSYLSFDSKISLRTGQQRQKDH